jgi:signal transduction histidine kinase
VTPDAVLHRYLDLAFAPRLDIDVLASLVALDAELLARWLRTLGTQPDPVALTQGLKAMSPQDLSDLAQAQVWASAPLGGAARLGLDQWRGLLVSACAAEVLARRFPRLDPGSARLRILLAISGLSLPGDLLLEELVAFRGVPEAQLQDAHPLLRIYAVVEALEESGTKAATGLAERLLSVEPQAFDALLNEARNRAEALVTAAGVEGVSDAEGSGHWRDRLWVTAQVAAFVPLLAGQDSSSALDILAQTVARSLFGHAPQVFLPEGDDLVPLGNSDMGALRLPAARSESLIARSWRERKPVELDDAKDLPVADRQLFRRMAADRLSAVPMLIPGTDATGVAGILLFRRHDSDPGERLAMMEHFAALLGRWLTRQRRQDQRSGGQLERYRKQQLRYLRELVHEANNPLSVIQNYLHILELKTSDGDTHEQLRMIGEEIRRASAIIRRASDLPAVEDDSAAAATGEDLNLTLVDLNQLASRVLEMARGDAEAASVSLQPALHELPVTVHSDPDRITQILTNLVRNAIEAMTDGGELAVETRRGIYRNARAGTEVSVADSGPGLPEAVLNQLFEPKVSQKGGTHAGLGLHITLAGWLAELEGQSGCADGIRQPVPALRCFCRICRGERQPATL